MEKWMRCFQRNTSISDAGGVAALDVSLHRRRARPNRAVPSDRAGDSGTVPTRVEQKKPLKGMRGVVVTLEPATRREQREGNQSSSCDWREQTC